MMAVILMALVVIGRDEADQCRGCTSTAGQGCGKRLDCRSRVWKATRLQVKDVESDVRVVIEWQDAVRR